MSISPTEAFGYIHDGTFYPIGESVPVEPDPDPPFRLRTPFEQPYVPESFWNTPVGSGATYLSTASAQHTNLLSGTTKFSTNGHANGNWSERMFVATESDPLSTVRHYAWARTGYRDLGPLDIGGTSTEATGRLYWSYEGIRIPANAQWFATTNTDRKCIVVMDFDCTLTVKQYNASNQLIATTTEFYPRGTLSVEMHLFYRTSGDGGGGPNTLYYTTNLGRSDLRSHGGGYGPIASGVSISQGLIRRWEYQAAMAGDVTAIRHALKVGVSGNKLKMGQIWPASHEDGRASETYQGQNPMGTMFVVNKDANIDTFPYEGSTQARNLTKAIAWTLQNFGAYLLIYAGSGPLLFAFEAGTPFVSNADATSVRNVFNNSQFYNQIRIVSNSNPYPSGSRIAPAHPSPVAGGGTRRTAGMGLDGFDDETGMQLPLSSDPADWHIT